MDLDDFFAKKDRKKSSKGKKFTTADEIVKKLEESGRRNEKLKKEKPPEVDEEGNTVVQDEDEWREFEEEKKDYSGLKIGNLTVADYDNWEEGGSGGEGEEEGGMEENEQGEMVPKKKAGPWRVIQNPTPAVEEQPQQPPPGAGGEPPSQPSQPSAYVPPSKRNNPRAMAPSLTPINSRLRRKDAPDVQSEEAFPTLSAAIAQDGAGSSTAWGKKKNQPRTWFRRSSQLEIPQWSHNVCTNSCRHGQQIWGSLFGHELILTLRTGDVLCHLNRTSDLHPFSLVLHHSVSQQTFKTANVSLKN